jgi:hypothetical protein
MRGGFTRVEETLLQSGRGGLLGEIFVLEAAEVLLDDPGQDQI